MSEGLSEEAPCELPPSPSTSDKPSLSPAGRIPTQPDPLLEQVEADVEPPQQELDVLVLSDDSEEGEGGKGAGGGGGRAAVGAWVGGIVDRVQQVKGRVTSATHNVLETVSHKVEAAKGVGREKVATVVTAGRSYVEGTKNVIKDQAHEVMDAGKELKGRLEQAASGVSHWVGDTTAATVMRAGEGVQQARQRLRKVRGYLTKGWAATGEGHGDDEDDEEPCDDYAHLLRFERAAEIAVGAGARERLPFVLREGDTVTWEFRVKEHDVGFGLSERVQDYGGAREDPLLAIERIKAGSAVRGSYKSSGEKSVVLVWDNSYSIFRPKSIAFIVRVLAPESEPSAAAAVSSAAAAVKEDLPPQQQEEGAVEGGGEKEEPIKEDLPGLQEKEEEAAAVAEEATVVAAVSSVAVEEEGDLPGQQEEAAAVADGPAEVVMPSSGVGGPVELVEEKVQEEEAAAVADEEPEEPAVRKGVVVVEEDGVVPIIEEL